MSFGPLAARVSFKQLTPGRLGRNSVKLVLGGVVLLGAVAFAYTILGGAEGGVVPLAHDDANQLKEVFFSGRPWLVHCADGKQETPRVFVGAA